MFRLLSLMFIVVFMNIKVFANDEYFEADTNMAIAVADFDIRGNIEKSDVKALADRFREKLIETTKYRVMERNQMDLILNEIGFQQTGVCRDNECLVQIGQIIAVQKIISGSVSRVGEIYSVNIKLLDVETGTIDKSVTEDCACPIEQLLTGSMKRLAQKIAGIKVEENENELLFKKGDASIFIKTDIDSARVYLDGKLVDGVTPITISNLIAGDHMIRVAKGNLSNSKTITLTSNKVEHLDLKLKKRSTTLKIETIPSEADIFINNKLGKKIKPNSISPAIFNDIAFDTLELSIFKVGYLDTTLIIPIRKNVENLVSVNLNKATNDIVISQKMILKRQKKRKIGIKLLIPGLAIAAGGGALYYLADKDYKEAKDLKVKLNASTIKNGNSYNEMIDENNELIDKSNLKSSIATAMLAGGGLFAGIGIVLQF